MKGLRLVFSDNVYQWTMSHAYTSQKGAVYLCSISYKTEAEAIDALIYQKIEWSIIA